MTLQDFGPVSDRPKGAEDLAIDAILPTDEVFTHSTQTYAKGGRRLASAA